MSYVIFIAGLSVASFLWFLFYRMEVTQLNFNTERLQTEIYNRQYLYLGVLRREFFNGLIEPNKILQLDMISIDYIDKIITMSEADFRKEMLLYFQKYPHIYDFNLIGERHDFMYYEVLKTTEPEEIENLYLDIVKCMTIFSRIQYGTEKTILRHITNIDTIKESVRKYDDNRLLLLARDAIRRKRFSHHSLMGENYEDADYIIEYIEKPSLSAKTGIYIKNTNEHIIYDVFLDDSRNKAYETFYRSNQDFTKQEYIASSSSKIND